MQPGGGGNAAIDVAGAAIRLLQHRIEPVGEPDVCRRAKAGSHKRYQQGEAEQHSCIYYNDNVGPAVLPASPLPGGLWTQITTPPDWISMAPARFNQLQVSTFKGRQHQARPLSAVIRAAEDHTCPPRSPAHKPQGCSLSKQTLARFITFHHF